jgi:Flp pilus assembly pilin Flp
MDAGFPQLCQWAHPSWQDFDMEAKMKHVLRRVWREDEGQDIAEYAVMLAVILVIVVGTIRLIGSNANNVFSSVASSIK